MKKINVLIMGAAGRDFHNFNVYFRNDERFNVIGFTAAQIPDIEGRVYPAELAGKLYPDGIKIYSEDEFVQLIEKHNVKNVYFSYSDVSHNYVMQKVSIVQSAGATFILLGPNDTMLKSNKNIIAVCAVRTGCGKSQTTRKITEILKEKNQKVVVIRHPMPYGKLSRQIVQKFEKLEDLDKYNCTIEEREEYEPHLINNITVYAGIDYEKILNQAEKEADFIIWDGGNNDYPFYKPDLWITVCDPHRPNHEKTYYPGETNFISADVIVINKIDSAIEQNISIIENNIRELNPDATVIKANSPISIEGSENIKGKRVLVIEDGPTLTHGGMSFGAGYIAAKKYAAKEIIDPRPYSVGAIKDTYKKFPHLDMILPAMGYGAQQIAELEQTINNSEPELVLIATPIDLGSLIKIDKPNLRVLYELEEITRPDLKQIISNKFNI
jgi:predicted GTPase